MNAYQQLLVHLDGGARSATRLALARRLAGEHGAGVVALYAVTPTFVAVPYAQEIGPSVATSLEARFHEDPSEPEAIGELLLSRVFDLGADLLVMGCYGHSRAREWVLGGASRTLLRSMTLPVLMAH